VALWPRLAGKLGADETRFKNQTRKRNAEWHHPSDTFESEHISPGSHINHQYSLSQTREGGVRGNELKRRSGLVREGRDSGDVQQRGRHGDGEKIAPISICFLPSPSLPTAFVTHNGPLFRVTLGRKRRPATTSAPRNMSTLLVPCPPSRRWIACCNEIAFPLQAHLPIILLLLLQHKPLGAPPRQTRRDIHFSLRIGLLFNIGHYAK
jgi:hypothetical protein